MLRTLGTMIVSALVVFVAAPPAYAEAANASATMEAVDVFGGDPALSDAALAEVHGRGPEPRAFVKRVARDGFEDFSRQTTSLLPVTFDNWFVDNAALIINNVVR